MKIIGYLTEENKRLYDVDTIRKLAGTSRSKIHRELKKQNTIQLYKYKNQFLYTEATLFMVLEKILIEKLDSTNEHRYS